MSEDSTFDQDVEYRNVKGYIGYRVGSDGSVWTRWHTTYLGRGHGSPAAFGNTWRNMHLTKQPSPPHYKMVALHRIGSRKVISVHTLVATAFLGSRPIGNVCRHLDGDGTNNDVSNLCWGTYVENEQDKKRHGRSLQGSKHPMAKLTEKDIPEIFRLRELGLSFPKIGNLFGVIGDTIGLIVRKKIWRHVIIEEEKA